MKKKKTYNVVMPRCEVVINQKAHVFKDKKKAESKSKCRKKGW